MVSNSSLAPQWISTLAVFVRHQPVVRVDPTKVQCNTRKPVTSSCVTSPRALHSESGRPALLRKHGGPRRPARGGQRPAAVTWHKQPTNEGAAWVQVASFAFFTLVTSQYTLVTWRTRKMWRHSTVLRVERSPWQNNVMQHQRRHKYTPTTSQIWSWGEHRSRRQPVPIFNTWLAASDLLSTDHSLVYDIFPTPGKYTLKYITPPPANSIIENMITGSMSVESLTSNVVLAMDKTPLSWFVTN